MVFETALNEEQIRKRLGDTALPYDMSLRAPKGKVHAKMDAGGQLYLKVSGTQWMISPHPFIGRISEKAGGAIIEGRFGPPKSSYVFFAAFSALIWALFLYAVVTAVDVAMLDKILTLVPAAICTGVVYMVVCYIPTRLAVEKQGEIVDFVEKNLCQ